MNKPIRWTSLSLAIVAVLGFLLAADIASRRLRAAETDASEKSTDKSADPFKIPEGNAKKLQAYINKLIQSEPEGDDPDEQSKFRDKMIHTLVDAAERLLEAEPNDQQAAFGHQYRLMGLQALVQLGDESAAERLSKAIAEARADKREAVAAAGWEAYLSSRLSDWATMDDKARADVASEVVEAVKSRPDSRLAIMIVHTAANSLERVDDAFVRELLQKALPILRESKNRQVREALEESRLEGMLRRMNLPGNPIEISGTLLDGTKFDWESYRGKVVLVDFWAQWCGPCRGEVPNVLDMYEKYHDKGFDVVGVSLDNKAVEAQSYIDEMKIPWPSIFPRKASERAWDNPLVKYYGIGGIPTAILVDQQGRVVHMEARGPNLRRELKRLLGDPVEKPETKPADDSADDSSSDSVDDEAAK